MVRSVYVHTLCPSVPGGDAGELIQVAIEGGVVHPPGYPTWTMLAYAFSRLPLGEPAWRINLSSAVFGAGAATLLSVAVGTYADCAYTGLVAGGAFAFAPLVWEYSTQGEVFALNNLNNALLLYLLVRFAKRPSLSGACAGAFAIGLALCNQHTLVFYCVPYAFWALAVCASRRLLTPGGLACLALSGLLGLAPYLYLPLASSAGASWGSWGDQRTLRGLLTHMLRREYGTFQLANTPQTTNSEYYPRLRLYASSVPDELPPLATPLLLIGLLASIVRALHGTTASASAGPDDDDEDAPAKDADTNADEPVLEVNAAASSSGGKTGNGGGGGGLWRDAHGLGLLLPLAYLLYVLLFNYLSNLPVTSKFFLQVQQRFWPQANLLCAAWYALGLQHTLYALQAYGLRPRQRPNVASATKSARRRASAASGLSAMALPAAAVILIGAHAKAHYAACDMSRMSIFRDFGTAVLSSLPNKRRVVLLTLGDEVLNAVRYAHRQLGHAPNVTVLDLNYMQFDWFIEAAKTNAPAWGFDGFNFPGTNYGSAPGAFVMNQLLDANYGKFSFFVCGGMHANDRSWEGAYRLWPLGMTMQVLKRTANIKLDKWASKSTKMLPILDWAHTPTPGSWSEVLANNHYLAAYHQRPYYVLQYAYEAMNTYEALEKQIASVGANGGANLDAARAQATQLRQEARERFLLAGTLYEQEDALALNGSRTLPDYFYRNWGVAYSQLLSLERSEEGVAAAKQRAAHAFLKYLAFESLEPTDRKTVEHGVLSLIPPPAGMTRQAAQQQQQQQQPAPRKRSKRQAA